MLSMNSRYPYCKSSWREPDLTIIRLQGWGSGQIIKVPVGDKPVWERSVEPIGHLLKHRRREVLPTHLPPLPLQVKARGEEGFALHHQGARERVQLYNVFLVREPVDPRLSKSHSLYNPRCVSVRAGTAGDNKRGGGLERE